jgi:anti-sigma regulatory factor (Ser/Thr protein kinase)
MDNSTPPSHPSDPGPIEFGCSDLTLRLDVRLPGDSAAITPVVESVLTMARQMKCAEGKEFEIEMALREALANAIRYGCGQDPSREVQCAVACDQSRGMLIVVRDPGPGFDPSALPSPIVGQNVFSDHGRGIYLINQLMDEVSFARGGTEIRMRAR